MPFTVTLESMCICLNTQARTVLHNGPSYQLQRSAEKNKGSKDQQAERKGVLVNITCKTNTSLYNYF